MVPPKLRKPLTRTGHTLLADEHDQLARQERPKVLIGIQNAAAEGDRSENAEYIYGRKRLRELDKRIRYLNHLLTDAQIIDISLLKGDSICFGSTVHVQDENGKKHSWMIVGEGEADYKQNKISWKSPVAKAFMGKKKGDFVYVERPAGGLEFEIISIQFLDR